MADDSGVLSDSFALSSSFGTNYDGSVDTQDNGVGRWGANTRDPALKGVALPEDVIRKSIGDPKDPAVKAAINSGEYQVEVTTGKGRTGLYPVVDMGPAPRTGKGIDLTGGAARDLGLNENSYVHYQLRKKDQSGSQQTKEEASPLAQLREKYPQYANVTDEQLIDKIYGTDPKFKRIDSKQFSQWMKSPTGGKAIQDAIAKGETPIQKFRDKYPQYGTLTDDQIAIKLLPIVQKKEPQMTLEGLKDRMNPKPAEDNWVLNWLKAVPAMGGEAVKQFGEAGLQPAIGMSEMEQGAVDRNLESAFSFSNPDAQTTEQRQALYSKYYAIRGKDDLETKELREQAFKADLFKQLGVTQKLQQMGINPLDVIDQFDAGMDGLDHRKEIEEHTKWLSKIASDIDKFDVGTLTGPQKLVSTGVGGGAAWAIIDKFPGVRELANYGSLYDQNLKWLQSKNPALGKDKMDQLSRKMADAQYPLQEVLALTLGQGSGMLTQQLSSKGLKILAELALGGGVGGGVFTANQLIRNVGSGQDWTTDLQENAFEGTLLGTVGVGARLTLNGIKTFLATSKDAKVLTVDSVMEATPKEANDFINGGDNNPITKRSNDVATTLGINSVKQIINQEIKDRARRGVPVHSTMSDMNVNSVLESLDAAETAHTAGDHLMAANKFDQALSLLDDTARTRVESQIRETVRTISQKDPLPNQEKITGWNELKPWQTQADVPEGAEVKIDPAGKTFWKAASEKTEETKQPDLTGFYGLDKAPGKVGTEKKDFWIASQPQEPVLKPNSLETLPKAEEEMYSGANPFAAARATKEFLDQQAFFKNWNKVFAPERLGEQASDTAALGKGITATEKTASTMAMRVLADEADLNKVIKNGVESSRRESYWHKYSKQELADIISKREKGEKTGNTVNDQMFDFYRKGYDYFGNRARANGIKMGWVEDYYRHSFKDSKAAEAFFQGHEKMWGDPSFTKTRSFPTINDAIAAGLEPKTYNPERNFLAYVASVNNAVRKVQHLRQMEQNGLAYQEGKNVPEIAKEWDKISTPDGKEYRVHPDSAAVLANMYNISSVYDTIAGPFVSFAGAVKGVSGIKLSWSGFHPLHIIGVDVAQSFTNLEHRLIKGKVTGKDFLDALASPTRPFTAPFAYGRLRDVMTGKAGKDVLEKLTDQERTDLRDLGEMGLVAHVSHERQMEWTQWLTRQANKIGPVSKAAGIGYKILIAEPYQKIMFQHMIPALKISQALARRDTLLRLHPDLYSNRMLRAREFQKINRDIEGRFGEMYYDNLLWNSMAKQVGVSVPLSLGWTLGFWRIYGDAATDLTDNAIHIDQIGKEATKNREWVTERMLYAANYSALAMVSCGLLTYAATGAIKSWMDFFYPRIGKKPNGDDERVRTPYFTTEWASMYQHYSQNAQKGGDPVHGVLGGGTEYLANKLNPGLQSIFEYWNNKDFRGREIHDPTDPWPTQLADTTAFFIQNMGLPMSAENIVAQHGQMTPEGTVASFFGLSSAPAWTGRTWIENSILTEYGREHGTEAGKSKRAGQLTDAKKEYEESLKVGNQQAILEARTKLKALGVTDRVIHESDKNYKIPIANRLFKLLDAGVQVKMLREMNPSERAEFLPYTSKKAKAEYERSLSQ